MIFSKKFIHKNGEKPIYYYFPQSFFSLWALMRAGNISTRSMLTPLLFFLCALFFK